MSTSKGRAAGFTLIELLVVIGIIAILVAISVGVGTAVMTSGKARQTADVIRTVESAIAEIRNSTESPIPWMIQVPPAGGADNRDTPVQIPLVDGVYRGDTFAGTTQTKATVPALAWVIKNFTEYKPVPGAEAIFNQIDEKFKRVTLTTPGQVGSMVDTIPGKRLDILDAWGNPLRFVHPQFDGVIPSPRAAVGADGGQMQQLRDFAIVDATRGLLSTTLFRRNYVNDADRKARQAASQPYMRGDSDGGTCNGDAPYVYSAGPDGDPSTREDNVYGTRPKFADPN